MPADRDYYNTQQKACLYYLTVTSSCLLSPRPMSPAKFLSSSGSFSLLPVGPLLRRRHRQSASRSQVLIGRMVCAIHRSRRFSTFVRLVFDIPQPVSVSFGSVVRSSVCFSADFFPQFYFRRAVRVCSFLPTILLPDQFSSKPVRQRVKGLRKCIPYRPKTKKETYR